MPGLCYGQGSVAIIGFMGNGQPGPDGDWQEQLDDLRRRVEANRGDIDGLQDQADQARHRADESTMRAAAQEARADANHERIGRLEDRADVDQKLIAELQADGTVTAEHAAHLEEALRSSRKIGAAIGIVMARRKVGETEAFSMLVNASQNTNRKLRRVADEVVDTGDVSTLPGA